MNRRPRLLWVQVLLGMLTTFAVSSTGEEPRRAASWDHYRVLSERNIFVRDRRRPRESQPASEQPAGVINTDEYLVLTGIGQDGEEGIALIENTGSKETIRARTGDPIGKGRLVKITLDYIEYECEGDVTRIGIGSTLAGLAPSRVLPQTAASTQPAAAVDAGTPGEATGADTAAILERMRRRREQETKR